MLQNLVVISAKHRHRRKKKNQTRYSKEYEKKYSFMRKCSSNVVDHEYKFHCDTCNTDLKCGAGGTMTLTNT